MIPVSSESKLMHFIPHFIVPSPLHPLYFTTILSGLQRQPRNLRANIWTIILVICKLSPGYLFMAWTLVKGKAAGGEQSRVRQQS